VRDMNSVHGNRPHVIVPAFALALSVFVGPSLAAQDVESGKVLYDRWCAECHGEAGAGDGSAAAFMLPRPRDFTRALYQIRSTASGELPTDDDIRRVIDQGMPGTTMPAWSGKLSARERDDIIAYLKSLSRFFQGEPPQPIDFGSAPSVNDEGLAEGARVFDELECFKCHGNAGRGDGPSAPTLTDDWDFPIRAADLTKSWTFNGGGRAEDIYRRLRTGLDGTPMPSYADVVDAGIITDEQLWRVAQYVASLSPDGPPRVREVLRAVRLEGDIPTNFDDEIWSDLEPSYVPLVGQIVIAPRWFAPRVDGVWVKALHNDDQLAIQITWNDGSRSPDESWQEYLERMARTMSDVDGPIPVEQGPDRLHIQFPLRLSDGMERPYFLGGDTRRPVYMWRWTSAPDELQEGTARGLDSFISRYGTSEVTHAADFRDGQWRLMLTRSLVPSDTSEALSFVTGRAIPIAFYASDGSNGEGEIRGAVSAWYAIYLDVPTPTSAYITPALAAVITAGLGVLVVARAQRRGPGISTSNMEE
jgi:mono/diheme cytochrome c family protein